jgi:hypothetical protein
LCSLHELYITASVFENSGILYYVPVLENVGIYCTVCPLLGNPDLYSILYVPFENAGVLYCTVRDIGILYCRLQRRDANGIQAY